MVAGIDIHRLARGRHGSAAMPVLLATFIVLALAGCAGTGLAVSPDQVDFGGNYASHGHP